MEFTGVITGSTGDTQIQINTGGLSGNYTTLLTLNNVHVDLVTLLANHQLVLA